MEGSPQTLPRGLERKAVRKLRRPSVQIYVSFLVAFIGRTWAYHAGSRTVRYAPPFLLNLTVYISPYSRSMPGALILSVTYGMDVKSTEDPFLRGIIEATHAFATATVPGKFLVGVIPMCASRRIRRHMQATDGALDSAVCPRLVPGNRVQGHCQRST